MDASWSKVKGILFNKAKENNIPLCGTFELTPRCNLACKMCYVGLEAGNHTAMEKELTTEEWLRIAGEARDAGMLYLLLTGGEIFLRKDFKTLYQELSHMGFIIDLFTNGTLITPDIARWLGRIPPSKITITLYGASPETYGSVCGSPEGYHRAIEGIDLLLSEGLRVALKTTMIRANAGDFTQIADFASSRKLKLGIVNYITRRRDGLETCPEAERLSPEELVEFENHVWDYYRHPAENSQIVKGEEKCVNEDRADGTATQRRSFPAFRCEAGNSSFWLTWDGRMTPCSIMAEPASFPMGTGFLKAWVELKRLCSEVPVCDDCLNCKSKDFCNTCPARLKAESGDYDQKGLYLCESAHLRFISASEMDDGRSA